MMDQISQLKKQWQVLLQLEYGMDQFNLLNCSLFFLIILLLLKLFRNNKINLPPSPPKLPIIGNLHQLSRNPHRSLQALSEKYGPLMLLHLGWAPTLVVSSADMVREIMKTHDATFVNRPKTTSAKILAYGYNGVAFTPYGQYWRALKKTSILEILSQKRVHEFQYVRDEEVGDLLNQLRKASSANSSVNLSELVISTSNKVISRCIFGEKFVDENGNSRIGEMSTKLAKLILAFSVGDFYFGFGWVDNLTGLMGRLKKTARAFDMFLEQVIKEHKSDKRDGKRGDFVDILLQIQQNDNLDFELSQNSIKALLQEMVVAGTESTASSLEWAIAELVKNPTKMCH